MNPISISESIFGDYTKRLRREWSRKQGPRRGPAVRQLFSWGFILTKILRTDNIGPREKIGSSGGEVAFLLPLRECPLGELRRIGAAHHRENSPTFRQGTPGGGIRRGEGVVDPRRELREKS